MKHFFRKAAGSTSWETVIRNNGTEQINTGVATTNAWHRFRIEMDDTNTGS